MSLALDVLNLKGEKVGQVDLPETVFGVKANSAVIHEVMTAYMANRRHGTHSTKTRGEVSGGGAKPWKQKHTGRARSGSSRSPLWRHGGVTFGPKPHKYTHAVPEGKKRLALKMVLSDLVREGKLCVLESFSVSEPKTRKVAEITASLKLPERSVLLVDRIDPVLARASRNLAGLGLARARDLNSYEALLAHRLVFTKAGLDQLIQRVSGGGREAA
jgi:large subunit ribosomal protein L4